MGTLHLNLKRKWFDMILAGEKKEEYREIKNYWIKRFFNFHSKILNIDELEYDLNHPEERYSNILEVIHFYDISIKKYETIIFSNGYSKDRDKFSADIKGVSLKTGMEEWGAEKNKMYFVFKLQV